MIFIIKATITLLSVLHFSVSFRSQSWKIRSYDLFKKGPSHLILHALPKSKQPGSNLPDLSQSRFPDIPDNGYDLVIIGSGPAGEAAAVRAAQLGARVAVVEKKINFKGLNIGTAVASHVKNLKNSYSTLQSQKHDLIDVRARHSRPFLTSHFLELLQAIREAANRICKAIDQIGGDRKKQIKSLWRRSFPILKTEAEVLQAKETRDRLSSNGIDLFIGSVEFVDAEGNGSDVTLRVCRPTECVEVVARHAAIASGSRPNRPSELPSGVHLPFLKGRVVTASEMALVALPTSIAIIGGGVIAVEYATVFAQLGVGVSLICSDDEFLPFLEGEIRSSLRERMSREHILFVRDTVREIRVDNSSIGVVLNPSISKRTPMKDRVLPERRLKVDLVLYSGGRNANSEGLELEAVNVSTSKYGRIVVDKAFRTTSSKSIYAIGDVIGPPGLASAAQQHGRSVSETLFGGSEDDDDDEDDDGDYAEFSDEQDNFFSSSSTGTEGGQDGLQQDAADTLFGASSGTITMDAPLTLWTLPEIASVGATLKQAQKIEPRDKLVEGRAYFKDMARGRLSGDSQGYVKIIAKIGAKRHTIIGVHIIGEGANELIQLGSILVHSAASLESVSRTPFAAVTLSGIYQMACDDALLKSPMRKKNKLSSL